MKLKLWQAGEKILRNEARPLTKEEVQSRYIQELIEHMRETLRDAPGVGLAAPQIGVGVQLAVIEDPPELHTALGEDILRERERIAVPFHVIVNPAIVNESEQRREFFEGCLSVTGFTAVVERARAVVVECLDEHGERRTIQATGWYARILQHEIDHLEGRLYLDRMNSRTFMSVENYSRHWKVAPIKRVLQELDPHADD